ncbi:hypothetical protein C8R47DRAFT_1259946 [Mycena vitilis]|nr:hypothetical protein C8R47DRAFT_1259946 [Mycena vitilis]
MPKTKKGRIDPQDQIRQLQAESARQKAHIENLEKAARKRKHRETLIPRPKGQAGRSVQHGGYNLQIVMGLDGDDERYNRLHRMVKRYIHEYLSVFDSIRDQESGRVRKMIVAVRKEIPFFQDFEEGWPVRDMARVYLSNEQTRRRNDEKAEQEAQLQAVSVRDEPARKKVKTIRFAHSDDEDEDDDELVAAVPKKKKFAAKPIRATESDNETDENTSKNIANKKAKRTAASRTVLSDSDSEGVNVESSKSKGPKPVVSSDENDSDDAQDLKKLIGRSGALKTTSKPNKTTVKKGKAGTAKNIEEGGSDLEFPYSLFGADEEYSPWESDDALAPSKPGKENKPLPKTNKRKSVSPLPASPAKKRKTEAAPRQNLLTPPPSKRKAIKPAGADSTSDDDQANLLTWNDLPKNCPATMCSDRLPSEPVPRILSLFNRLKTLTDTGGPSAKGVYFIHLEICQAITLEKRRKTILRLGKERRWPEEMDWDSIQYRIAAFKPEIVRLFKNSARLEANPIWRSFLLDINYELLEFCQSHTKQEFKAALMGKRCGYYGPQGEFLIYSCLLRLLSELDEDEDLLEVRLTATIHAIVVEGVDSESFHYDENDILTANYLCPEDFIRFILVPYIASALILEDQHWLQSLQDASFERLNSQEYGELVFPENIDGDRDNLDRIHQQNMVVINANTEAKLVRNGQREKPSSVAPPKHRKHADENPGPLKIRIPLPKKIQDQEITLKDFPSPSPSKPKQKPKAKPKKKQVKEVKTKGQKNEIISTYGTRSKKHATPT